MKPAIRTVIVALCLLLLTPARSDANDASEPGVQGHQLLFLFDTRGPRETFFIVSNPSDERVQIEMKLYAADLSAPIETEEFGIPAFGNEVINPRAVLEGASEIGLAVLTPIMATGRRLPVVPPEPLVGVVTRANTDLGAAHGDNPLGRLARRSDGSVASAGMAVDGNAASYEALVPALVSVPGYYNPSDLGPPETDGNQLVLIAFEDRYDDGFSVGPATNRAEASIFGGDGSLVHSKTIDVSGVYTSSLQDLASPETLSGSGKVLIEPEEGAGNLAGSFSMALAQFGGGGRLPSAAGRDPGEAARITGDQLLFPVDASSSRAPFLILTNPAESAVDVRVDAYPAELDRRLSSIDLRLAALGNAVVDPTSGSGLGLDQAGLLVVTPVASFSSGGPLVAVVPPEPLIGHFTQASLVLGEAFGENPLGRLAVLGNGTRADAGSRVGGSGVTYERLDPPMLIVPGFFNPRDLGGPDDDGNRLTLVAFEDVYGDDATIGPGAVDIQASFFDSAGRHVARRSISIDGLHTTSVQELADTALDGSGKVFLDVTSNEGSVFGVFSMALANFGVGLRLPPIDETELPTATPTPPSGQPTQTPGPTATPAPTNPGATPAPTSAATPSPPPATPAPTAQPTPGCRNGIVDPGEECDHGSANLECSRDPEFIPLCEPDGAITIFSCAYCEPIYDGGFGQGIEDCTSGLHQIIDPVDGCVNGDEGSSCSLLIEGQAVDGVCPRTIDVSLFQPGSTDAFESAPCTVCAPPSLLVGPCPQLQQNVGCTLDIGGMTHQGTCQIVDGNLLCIAGWKP